MEDLKLYKYQEEVVERALQGENIIIWLPTGSGKTRAAVHVAQKHLENTPNAKVVLLVNTVHLVNQHYAREFEPHLGRKYAILPVSGDTDEKDYFGIATRDKHVVICTAQILYNAMINQDDAKHAELSDITLLIIDECHHTQKETVYNKIMRRYVEKKLRRDGRLPQILGLTASPGAGGARTLEKAVDHVLEICANLDSAIVSPVKQVTELKQTVLRPQKIYDIVEKRAEDPFGDHLKRMMQHIHEFMDPPPDFRPREFGTQEYEADVVELKKRGNRRLTQCAVHLREYNDALLINDTLRMIDAYRSLEEFYKLKYESAIDATDDFLLGLFIENRAELKEVALISRFENPKMAQLESTLLKQFGSGVPSKGIVFSKTRKSTHYLQDWVQGNPALQDAGVRSAVLTGAGNGSLMTQSQQKATIEDFRRNRVNLLISTSVAEEGLDIPECNLVVRYGLLTNEIAQLQAIGRARAKDSHYSVVAQQGGREVHRERINEYLEGLTREAVTEVQAMDRREFRLKLAEVQREALISSELKDKLIAEKKSRNAASNIRLLCQNCFTPVANANDIRVIDNTHHVNVSLKFKEHYKLGHLVTLPKKFEDWEPGCTIKCNHDNCNMDWGYEINYKKKALLPNLCIKKFVVETPDGRRPVKKWKNVPFTVKDFSAFVIYHCSLLKHFKQSCFCH
uniref:RNA helicase n=1 Tax=Salarias fasciatus TaxID=181472 RepID=A0A672GIR8_SALFA